eukprot:3621933-Pyramimonas_sp.AAC.1
MAPQATAKTTNTTSKPLNMAQERSRDSKDGLKTAQGVSKTAKEGSTRPSRRARGGKHQKSPSGVRRMLRFSPV